MKLLIICLGNSRDLLLATPVLRCLRRQLVDKEIHFFLRADDKKILEANPFVDHFYDDETKLREMKDENYDQVIDLQRDTASAAIIKVLKKPVLRYKKLPLAEALTNGLKINFMPANSHIVQRFFKAVESLGVRDDGEGLDYFIPANAELTDKDIPASHHFGFVAITIEADSQKQLSAQKLEALCKSIDHPIVLMGSSSSFYIAETIASFDPIKVYNACGKFSFHETADLVRKSKVVITSDQTIMQVAAAMKKPVVAIGSSPAGKAPYYGMKPNLCDHVKATPSVADIVLHVNKRLAAIPAKTQIKL